MTNQRMLGVFTLAMMAIAAIINLRGLPLMASVGFSALFFYAMAALFFLIPSGLVCAELASAFPQAGGIYLWVREAFGNKTGFVAIWLEWINNVISFPASLSFIATTLAYIVDPHFAKHKWYLFFVILCILWGTTLFNMLGIRASARLNIVGALMGTLIPGALIIILGAVWLLSGHAAQINFSWQHLLPEWHFSNFAFFAGVLSGYSGIQLIAFHTPNVKNPRHDFPRAILLSVILILALTSMASLAIAAVVPAAQLSLVSGLIDGFSSFFRAFHLNWAVPILALLIVIGGLSTLSAWLMGPARGLAVAAQNGHFISFFGKENAKNAPARILILQACIATLFATLFLFTPNASTAFWVLLALSSQSTLLMYILVFGAVVALRYKAKSVIRPYKIPGGLLGVWLIAGVAIVVCLAAIVISFVPPTILPVANIWHYEVILIGGNFLYIGVPLIILRYIIH